MNAATECNNMGCCFIKVGKRWVLLLFFNIYFSVGKKNQGQSESTVTYFGVEIS